MYLSILVEDLDIFHAFSDLMKIPIVENGIVPASSDSDPSLLPFGPPPLLPNPRIELIFCPL